MDSASVRQNIQPLLHALNQRSYFAHFIDAFFVMPVKLQKALIEHIVAEINVEYFVSNSEDQTDWPEFVRALLIHYSGHEKRNEPDKNALSRLIGEFYKSDKASHIENEVEGDEFRSALGEL